MDSVDSTTYIKRPPNISHREECFIYTKEILGGRLFLGNYKERRYVPALGEYRDVVAINNEETELLHDVNKVRKKWMNVPNISWTGITGPDALSKVNTCQFWVKLTNLAFGNYWFQIKHVRLLENEVVFQMKCIRKAPPIINLVTNEIVPKNEESTSGDSSNKGHLINLNLNYYQESIQKAIKEAYDFIYPQMTWRNLLAAVKLTFAIVLAVIIGIISCTKSIGEFTLQFIRELSNLIQSLSPIIIQLIDFLTKLVGGFFILIAGMFGKNVSRAFVPPNENRAKILYPNLSINSTPSRNFNWRERNRKLREELLQKPN